MCSTPFNFSPTSSTGVWVSGLERYSETNVNETKKKEKCSLNKKEKIITVRNLLKSGQTYKRNDGRPTFETLETQVDKTFILHVLPGDDLNTLYQTFSR